MNYRPYPAADDAVAFPTLADSELAVLEALGTRRSVAVGEYLYREGDPTYDFYVILSGAVEIVVRSDGEERIITRQGPGRFLGELNLLTGAAGVSVGPRRRAWRGPRGPEGGAATRDRDEPRPRRHDPRRLSRPQVRAAERRRGRHPRRRFPVLARVAAGPGVPGPQPHPPRVAGPRSRPRR